MATKPGPTFLPLRWMAEEVDYGFLVSQYLVHCCLYHEIGRPVLSDFEFDQLASWLFDKRDEETVLGHPHCHLIDFGSLEHNSSGHYIQLPLIVRNCAQRIADGELKIL